MLYILPPPSAPNPPSPWNSILCGSGNTQTSGSTTSSTAGANFNNNNNNVNTNDNVNNNNNNNITNCASGSSGATWGFTCDKRPLRSCGKVSLYINKKQHRGSNNDSGQGVSTEEDETARGGKSLSECYFAGKGAAVVLPPNERLRPSRRISASGSDIQQHLQSMFYLLRPEETLKMAVKLESAHSGRTRYLVVVSCMGRQDAEESCLLGIDCNERTTVGLVLRVLADTRITLDGDGGFSVSVYGRQHIFKPVSVQAMWSALQTLHKVSSKAREQNYFLGGLSHDWVSYYEQRIESDRSCLNEWHAMDSLESRRPPSPDSVRTKPRERDETERVIRATLKEIMMSVDLDEVTSKYIRSRLEEDLDMDLGEFKSFIDQEMLVILGQMDAPTEIFEHVYLGSEWNASNLEELQKNGVGHILNVTREIDNFFPGMFDYLNIRVYDDEKTDLLKHWDNTFKYITRAKKEGSKVLVHCKMGVSRSASVVIAYAMKAYNWDFHTAMQHVKEKRNCIKPNNSFLAQLETYQGILDAMKNKEKLQRSKSETNLKSPGASNKNEKIIPGSEPTPMIQALHKSNAIQSTLSGQELRQAGGRPKSWSPDTRLASNLLPSPSAPTSVSLEHLNKESSSKVTFTVAISEKTSPETSNQTLPSPSATEVENRNVLMPCENGQVYSVSPNHIFHLPCKKSVHITIPSVKHRVSELESQSSSLKNDLRTQPDKKGLVLNLTSQFKTTNSKPNSPQSEEDDNELSAGEKTPSNVAEDPIQSQTKLAPQMLTAVLVKKEIWDPGEKEVTKVSCNNSANNVSFKNCDLSPQNGENPIWTSSTRLIEKSNSKDNNIDQLNSVEAVNNKLTNSTILRPMATGMRRDGDPFSNQLDRVFEREERKQQRHSSIPVTSVPLPQCVTETSSDNLPRECPSRQSSWSSYDSAVVLGYQGEPRDSPSRHSSWGSGDTRTLPSRNSSWGSYDIRPSQYNLDCNDKKCIDDTIYSSSSGMFAYDKDDLPGYPGTVKRTKQKLEENNDTNKKSWCTDKNDKSEPCLFGPTSTDIISSLNSGVNTSESDDIVVETCNSSSIVVHNPSALILDNCNNNNNNNNNKQSIKESVSDDKSELINNTKQIDIQIKNKPPHKMHPISGSRLSVSAPESRSIPLISKTIPISNSVSNITRLYSNDQSSVKKQKFFLERLSNTDGPCSPKRCFSVIDSNDLDNRNTSGIVKSLRREFEAKTSTNHDKNSDSQLEQKPNVRSLPASPVSTHIDIKDREHTHLEKTNLVDLSVKKLVGKYEERKDEDDKPVETHIKAKELSENKSKLLSSFNTNVNKSTFADIKKYTPPIVKNSLLVRNLNGCDPEFKKRPPVPPTVVKNTVPMVLKNVVTSAAANKKQQQHGKTHPLTRLTINKQRHNNPVYNTM